jgi:hypothetical protein
MIAPPYDAPPFARLPRFLRFARGPLLLVLALPLLRAGWALWLEQLI